MLCLLLALLPGSGADLRIESDTQGVKVKISAGISAKIAGMRLDQADGEKWLRLCLVDGEREGPSILGSYQLREGRLTFVPRYDLQFGRTYRAHVGEVGKPGKTLDYRVPDRPSSTPATVERVFPSADVLPANHLRFFIHFSAPMRGGKDIFDQIRVLDAQGNAIDDPWLRDELWDESGKMLILYIHPGRIKWGVLLRLLFGPVLEPDREYTLAISPDMLDAKGQRLGKEYRKKFRTTAEDRTRVAIEDWKVAPPRAGSKEPVLVAFPKVMDHSSLGRFLSIRDARGSIVAGKIDIGRNEKAWSFQPAQPWTAGVFTLVVNEQLEDTAGNTPLRPFDMDRKSLAVSRPRLTLEFRVLGP